jgi:hypothetical protein
MTAATPTDRLATVVSDAYRTIADANPEADQATLGAMLQAWATLASANKVHHALQAIDERLVQVCSSAEYGGDVSGAIYAAVEELRGIGCDIRDK